MFMVFSHCLSGHSSGRPRHDKEGNGSVESKRMKYAERRSDWAVSTFDQTGGHCEIRSFCEVLHRERTRDGSPQRSKWHLLEWKHFK
ncbi:hypothetical protein THAOC_04673 [Thalassiosira oceanica]|uniref:Uncharacterized protein n=1 Tax=Thalassiosira oceanica TaxID=159749 RepID=K0T4S0_THAOC|nr:hypothetical protein THAOC_04673 [Thalassiosira oceanica]|eukprot:EJK73688.1 hypothetical protein THAOC_04673 [Thalassiosira oceanica]